MRWSRLKKIKLHYSFIILFQLFYQKSLKIYWSGAQIILINKQNTVKQILIYQSNTISQSFNSTEIRAVIGKLLFHTIIRIGSKAGIYIALFTEAEGEMQFQSSLWTQ